jgi:hypothetical protein
LARKLRDLSARWPGRQPSWLRGKGQIRWPVGI